MDHCQHLILSTSWFLWTFLLGIRWSPTNRRKCQNLQTIRSLVFSKVTWRTEDNYNDHFIPIRNILVMRMVVTGFMDHFALELFLNLALES